MRTRLQANQPLLSLLSAKAHTFLLLTYYSKLFLHMTDLLVLLASHEKISSAHFFLSLLLLSRCKSLCAVPWPGSVSLFSVYEKQLPILI